MELPFRGTMFEHLQPCGFVTAQHAHRAQVGEQTDLSSEGNQRSVRSASGRQSRLVQTVAIRTEHCALSAGFAHRSAGQYALGTMTMAVPPRYIYHTTIKIRGSEPGTADRIRSQDWKLHLALRNLNPPPSTPSTPNIIDTPDPMTLSSGTS
eukprot:3829577-Rhodomonas_salina.3